MYTVIPGIQHIYTLSGKASLCSKYREAYIRRTLEKFTFSIIFQHGPSPFKSLLVKDRDPFVLRSQ